MFTDDVAQLRSRIDFLERIIAWLDSDVEDEAAVRWLASVMGAAVKTRDTYLPSRHDLRHLVYTLLCFLEWVPFMSDMVTVGKWDPAIVKLVVDLYKIESTRECNQCGAKRLVSQGPHAWACPNANNPHGSCDGTLEPRIDYKVSEYMALFQRQS